MVSRSLEYADATPSCGPLAGLRVLSSLAQLLGANWGHRSIDKIMQIFGGLGETLDMPITVWFRMLRHGRIGGGADEIHRMLIARNMLNIGAPLWEA